MSNGPREEYEDPEEFFVIHSDLIESSESELDSRNSSTFSSPSLEHSRLSIVELKGVYEIPETMSPNVEKAETEILPFVRSRST